MASMAMVKVGVRGNATAVTLPKDVLAASGIARGDMVRIEADADGLRIVRIDDAYARAMAAGQECFDRYPETLAELAR
ncbi:AbrB/MazE/SpoVT family DNA-binding domain-containing protein [Sandaracinobacteroides saxicola]|uniref:AbrB/MazE/SpoVT family DNA-binding domain-containing protein n=1 Tax=Sandaracinobacteroides saxicola TaxID=2759707 RepID=A0A7G5IHZ2_9SPHN|nr:AbrB/MazE/SpoVT family DNA-binding domain-containing protein [Sandaracinobacteroides saxicola]QMW22984.1 AbrB/MazE/SpoVT family DNA-binding domain-containing protein [Sandaracinobacteroides saxicola]